MGDTKDRVGAAGVIVAGGFFLCTDQISSNCTCLLYTSRDEILVNLLPVCTKKQLK